MKRERIEQLAKISSVLLVVFGTTLGLEYRRLTEADGTVRQSYRLLATWLTKEDPDTLRQEFEQSHESACIERWFAYGAAYSSAGCTSGFDAF